MFDFLCANKQTLTRASVKEAFDTMPVAICFFTQKGIIKLCNTLMDSLYRTLGGSDLQTLEELHIALEACGDNTRVIRLSPGGNVYLFPDKTAWQYSERIVTTAHGSAFTEVMFLNVTELFEKKSELECQREELHKASKELKKLSDTMLAVTREKEVLSFKTRLHDEMGAGLLAAGMTLSGEDCNASSDDAIRLWRRAVSFIKYDNEHSEPEGDYEQFMHDAASIGVSVAFNGVIPKDEEVHKVFLVALRECFTNCVRYAGATEMYVDSQAENGVFTLRITNNGEQPKADIVPGGGLTNLIRQAESIGGVVTVKAKPCFELVLTIGNYLTHDRRENAL